MRKIYKKDFTLARDSIEVTPGKALAAIRKLQELSQSNLAKLTGISQANISSMERGHQQIGRERALVLAKALNVHPAVILFPDYQIYHKAA